MNDFICPQTSLTRHQEALVGSCFLEANARLVVEAVASSSIDGLALTEKHPCIPPSFPSIKKKKKVFPPFVAKYFTSRIDGSHLPGERALLSAPWFCLCFYCNSFGLLHGKTMAKPRSGGWSYLPLLTCNFNNGLNQCHVFSRPFVKQGRSPCMSPLVGGKIQMAKNHLIQRHLHLKLEIGQRGCRNALGRRGRVAPFSGSGHQVPHQSHSFQEQWKEPRRTQ